MDSATIIVDLAGAKLDAITLAELAIRAYRESDVAIDFERTFDDWGILDFVDRKGRVILTVKNWETA